MNSVLDIKILLDVNKAFSEVKVAAQDIDTIFTHLAYYTKFMT